MSKKGSFYVKGFDKFLNDMRTISEELDREIIVWLEALGMEFLQEIQNQIVEMGVVDTRRLLNSFDKGGEDSVWELTRQKLELRIGTNVEYARWVNDGHWTVAQTSWVEGRPYFDVAFAIFKKLFEKSLERKMSEWMKRLR